MISVDRSLKLGNDDEWELLVNDDRVLLRSRRPIISGRTGQEDNNVNNSNCNAGWTSLSHAVLNGGLRTVTDRSCCMQVLNARVPEDYDGISPNPVELLKQLARKESNHNDGSSSLPINDSTTMTATSCCSDDGVGSSSSIPKSGSGELEPFTIGLLTAASMNSTRVATRKASSTAGWHNRNNSHNHTCIVDVIVTAGISNARAAGASADVFTFTYDDDSTTKNDKNDDDFRGKNVVITPSSDDITVGTGNNFPTKAKQQPTTHFGTINTIILINSCLDETTALVEAYSVAVEAKCKAMAALGIMCGKNPNEPATGTGTDTSVLVCRKHNQSTGKNDDGGSSDTAASILIPYAGKHTLIGELIGQAVYEATNEALESNLDYMYKSSIVNSKVAYRFDCIKRGIVLAIQEGHRPVVPSQPMKPIPGPNNVVLTIGLVGLILSCGIHLLYVLDNGGRIRRMSPRTNGHGGLLSLSQQHQQLIYGGTITTKFVLHQFISMLPRPDVSVLLAVMIADRFLGSVLLPLMVHPVVLVGRLITMALSIIPESCFDPQGPIRGFVSGCLLFVITVVLSLGTASLFLLLPSILWSIFVTIRSMNDNDTPNETCIDTAACNDDLFPIGIYVMQTIMTWSVQVFLLRGSLNIQLLCSVALQMADLLERNRLQDARIQLCWLCSRDASQLRPDELAGATLESLSENLSDSLTGPLLYYVLFGPLGAFAYKVMNTLDSRVGYRGRYEWVGKVSARIDDGINLIPARLTAIVLIVAAALWNQYHDYCGQSNNGRDSRVHRANVKSALFVAWRDAKQCDSPNAGWPMATFAGLLNVRLEKRDQYSLNGPINNNNNNNNNNDQFNHDDRMAVGVPPDYNDIRRGQVIADIAGIWLFLLAMVSISVLSNVGY